MEVKHKECFIPNIIKHFGLAAVSKYAREAAEFVNLYSKHRGINRFPALVEALDLLKARPEVRRRGLPGPRAARPPGLDRPGVEARQPRPEGRGRGGPVTRT